MMKSFTEGPFVKPKNDIPLTAEEITREKVDREAKSNLMLALPNSIYNRIDCFKQNPMMMWTQLEKIMLGSAVATQLRQTRFMNNFEEFKAKDGETLKNVFDRFCIVMNDMQKIKVEKTELETNLKFLNALQPEWNKSCHKLRNDIRISTMQIQELYEILMTDESIVKEKKAKHDKKNKKTVEPVALLTSQLAEQALSENVYDGATDEDGEVLQKAMILLSQHYKKKFQHRSGSNNLRFTSGSKNEPAKVPETTKAAACFNYGKSGHIAKECRVKVVRDSAYYRKKMELTEKREREESYSEAEYVAAASCRSQVLWMRTQLRDYGYTFHKVPIYYDSKSAIAITSNPVQHSKIKHIDIRFAFWTMTSDHIRSGLVLHDLCLTAKIKGGDIYKDQFQRQMVKIIQKR
ncbi:hypothetical protein L6452_02068 [Arctium lappa]|uniref:Uncharacterized protein n=1 Tax=Arctium lappa TaxID=4217 RepID=A0ACB9FJC2_ARCLA|nr:hypothetical protein L6452_02068 [Arctium lappa]